MHDRNTTTPPTPEKNRIEVTESGVNRLIEAVTLRRAVFALGIMILAVAPLSATPLVTFPIPMGLVEIGPSTEEGLMVVRVVALYNSNGMTSLISAGSATGGQELYSLTGVLSGSDSTHWYFDRENAPRDASHEVTVTKAGSGYTFSANLAGDLSALGNYGPSSNGNWSGVLTLNLPNATAGTLADPNTDFRGLGNGQIIYSALTPVSEPASLTLVGVGLLGLGIVARKQYSE